MRTELSKKSEYYISKERRMELAHFCKQYPTWIKERILLIYSPQKNQTDLSETHSGGNSDPTSHTAFEIAYLTYRIDMVEKAARETDPIIGDYIFQAAIRGLSYNNLNAYSKVPCCRNEFYKLYRKFFWILDRKLRHTFAKEA